MDVQYDLETRKAYQARIEDEPAARITTKREELAELAGENERGQASGRGHNQRLPH